MPEAYINYYKMSLKELAALPKDRKPTLLLHACCGPCSTFPLTFLCPHFDVTIYYNNSNIFPEAEYQRRLEELKKFLGYFKRDYGYDVKLIVPPYDNVAYTADLAPYALEKEGGKRCVLCYTKRMGEAYDYAEAHGYDYFTTVMTISRQKNSEILNAVGKQLAEQHQKTHYFYSDFKKAKGIDIAREMRIHYGLYNQLYCGCQYSYAASLKKADSKDQNWKG
ncbi:MAG: hypothetical protein BWY98_00615 [Tenericutes bacterium ADurb.BinA155]|jgi:epoxyqueuosine reductase|nr:MAG: hypothetical protein BWY98_00615 [Tenericutes bacterium ADurb.BinA155]